MERSPVTRVVESRVTLATIRASLSDQELKSLIDGTFEPTEMITLIQKKSPSRFAEDCFIETKPIYRKTKSPKKAIPLSERYMESVKSFERGELEPNAEVVLGYYFSLYKRYFHEEDPDWAGANATSAIHTVDKIATELTAGDYRKIVTFVRKIFPLWVQRLRNGDDFPGCRPSTRSMFGGNRYFWANRNLIYKQWQNK